MFSHHLCFPEGLWMKDSFLWLQDARSLQTIASFFGDPVQQTIWFMGERCKPFFFRSKSEECPMTAGAIFWPVREHLKNYLYNSLHCLFGTNRCHSTSPWRLSDPWNLSAEQWVPSASCFGLHEGPSTWCDLGRSSPSSWEQTLYGQTTKQSCCPWNQVVKWSLWNRRSRQKWTCGWEGEKMEDPTVANANETWCARVGKKSKRHTLDMSWTCGSILNHTRWNIACTKCAVCTAHRLHGNRCCLWTKTWKKKQLCSMLSKKPPL